MDTQVTLLLLWRVIVKYVIPLSVPSVLFGIILSLLNKYVLRGFIPSTTIVVLCVMVFFLTIAVLYVQPEEYAEFIHQLQIFEGVDTN